MAIFNIHHSMLTVYIPLLLVICIPLFSFRHSLSYGKQKALSQKCSLSAGLTLSISVSQRLEISFILFYQTHLPICHQILTCIPFNLSSGLSRHSSWIPCSLSNLSRTLISHLSFSIVLPRPSLAVETRQILICIFLIPTSHL